MKSIYCFGWNGGKRLILVALTSIFVACASVAEYPISGLQLQAYPSVVAAVTAASNRYNPISLRQDREFMGLILERGNDFYYTVAAGGSGADQISITLPNPHFGHVVALWHTHGRPLPEHRYFSATDTRLVQTLQLPFYLADDSGLLKVFTPQTVTLSPFAASRLGLPKAHGMSKGELVIDNEGRLIAINLKSDQIGE